MLIVEVVVFAMAVVTAFAAAAVLFLRISAALYVPRCRAADGPCRQFVETGACLSPNGCGCYPPPSPPRKPQEKTS